MSDTAKEYRIRIVYAEDEIDQRQAMQQLLKREGYEVVVCENGRSLLEECERRPPDLVITDINMPEMTGTDAAKAIRAVTSDHPHIPIVFLTAYNTSEYTTAAGETSGIIHYCVKTSPFQAFLATLNVGLTQSARARWTALGEPSPPNQKLAVQFAALHDIETGWHRYAKIRTSLTRESALADLKRRAQGSKKSLREYALSIQDQTQ